MNVFEHPARQDQWQQLCELLDQHYTCWYQFMELSRRYVGEALKRGRPTKQEIANSIVGAMGFNSWREMIESPRNQGGLGWKWSTWNQWQKAYRVVQQLPELVTERQLEPAAIVRLSSAMDVLPKDIAAWDVEASKLEDAKKRQSKSLERVQVEALETTVKTQAEQIELLQRNLKDAEEDLKRYQGLTRFQLLKAAFFGWQV